MTKELYRAHDAYRAMLKSGNMAEGNVVSVRGSGLPLGRLCFVTKLGSKKLEEMVVQAESLHLVFRK